MPASRKLSAEEFHEQLEALRERYASGEIEIEDFERGLVALLPLEPPRARHGLIRENAYRDVWLLVITALVLWALFVTYDVVKVANRTAKVAKRTAVAARTESRERRNQTCVVFERMHQVDVGQLAGSYQYLADLSRQQAADNLNRAILRQLPITEKRTAESEPPRYCRRPGVGLNDRKLEPEPKRPPEVERLLSGR